MRYAIVTETYPPEVNGVALTVESLECGLRTRGHSVSLVRPRQHGGDREPNDGLLVPGAALPRYPGLKFGLPVTGRLSRHWRDRRPDVIYVATEGPLGWAAQRAASGLGIPVLTGLHTRFDEYMRDYGLSVLRATALRWMRHFHNRAAATLVPTQELMRFLQANGFRHVLHLPRGIDSDAFSPRHRDPSLRARWGLEPSDLAVIHVGRIAAEKNLDLAVAAFRALHRMRPDARFIWVGDGPLRQALQRENPDFIFCGIHRGPSLSHHFASGDLFLFPSRSETFGNVTLEAMASGVPTVAFDHGAAHEHLRDGVHGACVLGEKEFIQAAVDLALDDARRTAMARAAPDALRALRPERIVAQFDALLAAIAGRTCDARLIA
ncbi:MAG: glycosyltransferase family 1 protein [Xanthomonadaceae bacterium]|nr:glycosyltransferase family 1 protein [Xanthomonadaceae bacterium]